MKDSLSQNQNEYLINANVKDIEQLLEIEDEIIRKLELIKELLYNKKLYLEMVDNCPPSIPVIKEKYISKINAINLRINELYDEYLILSGTRSD